MPKRSPLMRVALATSPSLKRRSRLLENELLDYRDTTTRADIESFQLATFNANWKKAVNDVPFYSYWKAINSLPNEIIDLRQLKDFPILTKSVLQESSELVSRTPGIKNWISTGGSTGEPVRLPQGRNEVDLRYVNNYVARAWSGVSPADRYLHVWGHAHLFGSGVNRLKKVAVRAAKDHILGAIRVPSYDQSLEKAVEYAHLLLNSNPVYVIGATSSVVRMAYAIEKLGSDWRSPANLRAVIVTAEAAAPADVALIARAFGVPCYVEYGASESGVIACSKRGERSLSVLWRSVHLWSGTDDELRVTSLGDRAFPLLNYALGDCGRGPDEEFTLLEIHSLEGRSHEILQLRRSAGDLVSVNCTGIVHSVKANSQANSVQMAQLPDGRTAIGVTSYSSLDLSKLRRRLISDLRASVGELKLDSVAICQLDSPILTPAGKIRVLLNGKEAQYLSLRTADAKK